MKAAVIINPLSGRGNGKGLALAKTLQGNDNISLHVMENFWHIQPALRAASDLGVEEIYISSGDGTIQAVLSFIIEYRLFKTLPRICILPHGTTNLTGIDLALKRRSIADQAAFIASSSPRVIKSRHTLHILNPRGHSPRHGFTLGAGAAAVATRMTQTDLNDKGRKGQLAAATMMAGAMWKAISSKADRSDKTRLDRPHAMHVATQGQTQVDGDLLMFFATTLEKQFFGTKPFWGGKHGAIRATGIPYPVPNLLRWTWPIMYGGEERKVPPGAVSFSSNSFEISCAETYVMDGEFFEGPEHGPLKVQAGPAVEFIVG